MVSIKVEFGQNLADIAMQYYGSIEGWVQVATDNELSLTEELVPGSTIYLRDEQIIDRQIVTYYAKKETVVATENQ